MFTIPICLLAALTGCVPKRVQPEMAAPKQPALVAESPAEVLHAQTASVGVRARMVYRARREGAGDAHAPAFMLEERDAPPAAEGGRAAWKMRRSTGPAKDGPWKLVTELTFVLTAEGHAAVSEEIDHDEGVELVYDPPMVVMPAELKPGAAAFTQTTYLRVYPSGSRKHVKAEGSVKQKIEHLGGASVDIPSSIPPAAQCACQQVVKTFTSTLKPAEVVNVVHQWIVPGVGMIAETSEERTKVFGVQTRHNRESWVVDEKRPLP